MAFSDAILFLGLRVRTWIFILIGIFLFLIFSMAAWPQFWRKVFEKQRKKNIEARKQNGK